MGFEFGSSSVSVSSFKKKERLKIIDFLM